jgi:segregation and condensation protein B
MFHRELTAARQLRSVCLRYASRSSRVKLTCRHPADHVWCVENKQSRLPASQADRDQKLARLEAVLFLAKEPLHARKLAKLANLADGTQVRTLAGRLNDLYDRACRAFRVEEVAGGLQLRTRAQFGTWLRRLGHVSPELRLSAPAMETLSIVAYRQPVLRADIEAVRGVACGEILRQLMEKELVRVAGRSEELGRPYLYGTTRRFLEVFGLRSLDELPRAEVFRESSLDNSSGQSQADQHSSITDGPQQEGESEVSATIDNRTPETVKKLSSRREHETEPEPQPARAANNAWDGDDDFEDEEYDDEDYDDELDDDEEEWVDDDDDEVEIDDDEDVGVDDDDEFDDLDEEFDDEDEADVDIDDEEDDAEDDFGDDQWEEVDDNDDEILDDEDEDAWDDDVDWDEDDEEDWE